MTRRVRRFLADRRSKTRWSIAALINRLGWTCWADLVGWVQNWDSFDPERRALPPLGRCSGWTNGDIARTGTCYCGKQPRGALERQRAAAPKATGPDPWATS